MAARFSERVRSVNYSMSPDHPYTGGMHHALAAYQTLVNDKEDIIVNGHSTPLEDLSKAPSMTKRCDI